MAYSAPSSRSTSDLITAAIWNADVVANPIAIYAGAMSVSSQAVGDILYASSTTQLGRIAAVATGQVLTSAGTGTVPAWSSNLDLGGTLDVTGNTTLDADLGVGGAVNHTSASRAITLQAATQARLEIVGTRTSDDVIGEFWFANRVSGTNNVLGLIRSNRVGADNTGSLSFHTYNAGAASLALTLGATGKVGIDETTPNDPLHITTGTAGAITAIRLQHDNSSTNDAVSIDANMTSDITTSGQINFKRVGTNAATEIIFSNTNTTGSLSERMRIDRAGQVGIGTDDPDCPLRVGFDDSRLFTLDALRNSGDIAMTFCAGTSAGTTAGSQYGKYACEITTNTDGAEAASFTWDLKSGGSTTERMVLDHSGNLTADGTKSFRIDHPLPALTDTHRLVYYATEGCRADLLFRGSVDLVAGTATVDVDAVSLQTDGTFVALTRDAQIWVHNATGWDAVRGSLSGNTLTITCQDSSSTDTIHWLIVADRYDNHMQTNMTTDPTTGRPLVEYEKPEVSSPSASLSPSASASPSE